MRIRDVMRTNVATLGPEATVWDAAKLMSEKKISSVIIVEDSKPVGIVTEKDCLERVLAVRRDPGNTKLREIMSSPVESVLPDMSIWDGIVLMQQKDYGQVLVSENNKIVGIVGLGDLRKQMAGFFSAHRG